MPINFEDTAANFLEFPAYYYYYFKSSNGLELYVLRDEAAPKQTGGLGGWEIVERRRRKGLTNWTGREPWQMSVPILFDGWYDPPYSVDPFISVLNKMAFGDNFVIPPSVTVEGVLPITGIKWVIQNIDYGEKSNYLKDDVGNMIHVRQDAVVSLLQYVEEDVVPVSKTTTASAAKPYTTKEGDTPRSIAKLLLGNADKWTVIRDLNPTLVRDPNQRYKDGVTLQMPGR